MRSSICVPTGHDIKEKSMHCRYYHRGNNNNTQCTLRVGVCLVILCGHIPLVLLAQPRDPCRLLGLLHPASHGSDSSRDCRRVIRRISPNEFDRHDPSVPRGLGALDDRILSLCLSLPLLWELHPGLHRALQCLSPPWSRCKEVCHPVS